VSPNADTDRTVTVNKQAIIMYLSIRKKFTNDKEMNLKMMTDDVGRRSCRH
jgi:hypothetical protein